MGKETTVAISKPITYYTHVDTFVVHKCVKFIKKCQRYDSHKCIDNDLSKRKELRLWVLNATFNNISVITWRSHLLLEETEENHELAASH
jgi:hypothetical protein